MIDFVNTFLENVFNTHNIIVDYGSTNIINIDLGIVITWSIVLYVGVVIICLFVWLLHIIIERVD